MSTVSLSLSHLFALEKNDIRPEDISAYRTIVKRIK